MKSDFSFIYVPYRISFEVKPEVLDFPDIEHFQMPKSDRKSQARTIVQFQTRILLQTFLQP